MTGWLLVAAGAVLALPQIVTDSPWQAGFALGVVLALFGLARLMES